MGIVKNMEKEIPASAWMEIPEKEKQEYVVVMREARISMRDKGIYDKRMLSLMKRVRCQITPTDGECAMNLE